MQIQILPLRSKSESTNYKQNWTYKTNVSSQIFHIIK